MRKISIWNHSTCVYHKRPSRFSESHIRKNSKNNSQNQEGECVITGTSYSLNSHFQGRTGLARQPTQARENAAHHRPRPGAAWALLLPGEQNNRLKFWLLLPFVLPLIVLIEVNDVSSHCNKSLGFSGEPLETWRARQWAMSPSFKGCTWCWATQTNCPDISVTDKSTGSVLQQKCVSLFLLWYVQTPKKVFKVSYLWGMKKNENKDHKGFRVHHIRSKTSFHLQKLSVQAPGTTMYICVLNDTVRKTKEKLGINLMTQEALGGSQHGWAVSPLKTEPCHLGAFPGGWTNFIIGGLRVKEHCEIVSWKWGKERFIKTLSMSGRKQIVL